jgi:2-succinyl-5-enolpyruvyl-6-hydroxy-3-cyclohexene-1-carboxylate synthase
MTKYLPLYYISIIAEELSRLGVKNVCISPGSRSTPLVYAFTSNKKFRCSVAIDERAAAFFALGLSKASTNPTVLICTSGTALTNYLPAIVEASHSNVPLLILSADRPYELYDSGANQTIHQEGIFGRYADYSFNFTPFEKSTRLEFLLSKIDYATSLFKKNESIVHLNFQFREPLFFQSKQDEKELQKMISSKNGLSSKLNAWKISKKAYTEYIIPSSQRESLSSEANKILELSLKRAKRPLLIISGLKPYHATNELFKVLLKLKVPHYFDITSNLKLIKNSNQYTLNRLPQYCDALQKRLNVHSNTKKTGSFDLILLLGALPVQKKLLELLNTSIAPKINILLPSTRKNFVTADPNFTADYIFESDPFPFLLSLTKLWQADTIESKKYTALLGDFEAHHEQALQQCIYDNNLPESETSHLHFKTEEQKNASVVNLKKQTPLNEVRIVNDLVGSLPDDYCLYFGNSLPIRIADGFILEQYLGAKNIPIGYHRGASGIDGTISQAIGFGEAMKKNIVIVTGDLALLHDMNALLLIKEVSIKVIILVLNNNGGGIFYYVENLKEHPSYEKYFITPQNIAFEHLAEQFSLKYALPKDEFNFVQCFKKAVQSKASSLIEISCDGLSIQRIHNKLTKILS